MVYTWAEKSRADSGNLGQVQESLRRYPGSKSVHLGRILARLHPENFSARLSPLMDTGLGLRSVLRGRHI